MMFFATNSPLILYGRFATTRSAISFVSPRNNTRSLGEAVLTLMGATPADGAAGCGVAGVGAFGMNGAVSVLGDGGGAMSGDLGTTGGVGNEIDRSRSLSSF